MEARNYMVNDWVEFYQPGYGKVQLRAIPHSLSRYKPIPLTEEILKKNGFIVRNYGELYLSVGFPGNDWCRSGIWVRFYERVVIEIECNHNGYTNRVHLIANYVHELQHALRLCGLNELADNFKI